MLAINDIKLRMGIQAYYFWTAPIILSIILHIRSDEFLERYRNDTGREVD
jgi:hypothetical protein